MSDAGSGPEPADRPFDHVHLDDLERVRLGESAWWRPLRRRLGLTAFGANGYTADQPGDELIEPHDETSAGAGGHDELYLVAAGRAAFTVDGERLDAPAGTCLHVRAGVHREAVAREPATTVLVIGGRPGSALPVSPFEYWYAAQPASEAGDYARAIEIASEGLRDHPEHGTLHYQLACYHALAGDREEALRHVRIAFANDPRTRGWAVDDADLDAIRDDPAFPRS